MADDITVKTKIYTDKVRNAMYGKEVRSSIADSIDGIAQNVKDEMARDTLAINVNKNTSDIAAIGNCNVNNDKISWENSEINASGEKNTSTKKITNTNIFYSADTIRYAMTDSDDYFFVVAVYDVNNNFLGWWDGKEVVANFNNCLYESFYELPKENNFYIMLANSTSNVTVADASHIKIYGENSMMFRANEVNKNEDIYCNNNHILIERIVYDYNKGKRTFNFPADTTLYVDSTINLYNDMKMIGHNTTIVASGDFPIFKVTGTQENKITDCEIKGFNLCKTPGKYFHIILISAYRTRIHENKIYGGILPAAETDYFDDSNLEDSSGIYVTGGFVNYIYDNHIVKSSITFENSYDSYCYNNIIWAYNRLFGVLCKNTTNILIEGNQIIGSAGKEIEGVQYKGGVCVIDSALLKIVHNEFDGNNTDIVDSGCAVYTNNSDNLIIQANDCYWYCTSAFVLNNTRLSVICENNFSDNNRKGIGVADIELNYSKSRKFTNIIKNNIFNYGRTDYPSYKAISTTITEGTTPTIADIIDGNVIAPGNKYNATLIDSQSENKGLNINATTKI